MSPEKKQENFEQIIRAEMSDEDLDSILGLSEVSEKVSERVGESAGKSIPTTKKTSKKSGIAKITQKIQDLIFSDQEKTEKPLPPPEIQRKEVKKALVKKTRSLIKEATKIQNSKKFSASRLEQIFLEIRHLQSILSSMFEYTAHKIESLYRKFVLKQNS
jgi:hypothetical protein